MRGLGKTGFGEPNPFLQPIRKTFHTSDQGHFDRLPTS